ncbi:MAG: hypothetical protein K0R39_1945 [Symbiobacteriaceae bacterium]|jgi:hypothetical protein|nr:hypothetical protein [Symbiobacteriaceae bacterium]
MGPVFFDWIMGVAFRPGATFERAREQLRFGYWWIILTVITLEAVIGIYGPAGYGVDLWADVALFVALQDMILYDIQALMLMGAARLVAGWQLSWFEAHKFSGLLWSIIVLEDIATFYPALVGLDQISLWTGAFFSLWYVFVMFVGLRRTADLSAARSLLITLLAGLVWRGGIFIWTWWPLISKSL